MKQLISVETRIFLQLKSVVRLLKLLFILGEINSQGIYEICPDCIYIILQYYWCFVFVGNKTVFHKSTGIFTCSFKCIQVYI